MENMIRIIDVRERESISLKLDVEKDINVFTDKVVLFSYCTNNNRRKMINCILFVKLLYLDSQCYKKWQKQQIEELNKICEKQTKSLKVQSNEINQMIISTQQIRLNLKENLKIKNKIRLLEIKKEKIKLKIEISNIIKEPKILPKIYLFKIQIFLIIYNMKHLVQLLMKCH